VTTLAGRFGGGPPRELSVEFGAILEGNYGPCRFAIEGSRQESRRRHSSRKISKSYEIALELQVWLELAPPHPQPRHPTFCARGPTSIQL
jgi:hypothetical protein